MKPLTTPLNTFVFSIFAIVLTFSNSFSQPEYLIENRSAKVAAEKNLIDWCESKGLNNVITFSNLTFDTKDSVIVQTHFFANCDCEAMPIAWEDLSTSFAQKYNYRLEEYLLSRVSFTLGIPQEQLEILISSNPFQENPKCSNPGKILIRWQYPDILVENSYNAALGNEKGTLDLDKISLIRIGSIVDVQTSDIEFIAKKVEEAAENYFVTGNKTKDVYNGSPSGNSVEFIVINIQNHILVGKDFWERIRLTIDFSLYPRNALCIQIHLDAGYLNGEKPSRYASDYRNMEMEFINEVDLYEKSVIQYIKDFLSAKR